MNGDVTWRLAVDNDIHSMVAAKYELKTRFREEGSDQQTHKIMHRVELLLNERVQHTLESMALQLLLSSLSNDTSNMASTERFEHVYGRGKTEGGSRQKGCQKQ